MGWTESDRDTLRQLWPDESATVIAKKLKRTRSAIIGQAHRMNLPAKRKPYSGNGRPHKPRPRPQKTTRVIDPTIIPVEKLSTPYSGPVSILEVGHYQCRAIIESTVDDNGLAMMCGKPVDGRQPFLFCSEHLDMFLSTGARNVTNTGNHK